eukprot:scaffold6885_cov110-Isochrysis_galbana.AAC.2
MQKGPVAASVCRVGVIADDGEAGVREVQPDLVPTPRLWHHPHQAGRLAAVRTDPQPATRGDHGLRVSLLPARADTLPEAPLGRLDASVHHVRRQRPFRVAEHQGHV